MSSRDFNDMYSDAEVWNPWYGLMSINDPETAILLAAQGDDPRVKIYTNEGEKTSTTTYNSLFSKSDDEIAYVFSS
ncbi:MAG: hypothetical protein O9262_05790 [Cyclobacteriaceae bacterium]|nr:hypothetical protein [Cyclobacteriaceae bacterium]